MENFTKIWTGVRLYITYYTMEGDTREALEKELTQQNGAPARRKPAARDPSSHEEQVLKRRTQLAEQTYGRGERVPTKNIRDKKLRGNMRALERRHRNAALQAKDAEILLEHSSGLLEAEGELEKTYRVRQDEIKQSVGVEAAKKGFELKLEDLGPYVAEYTRNGRQLLLAGQRGHVATVDWREGRLGCEIQLGETVRDAKWLHNDQSFAVAQKKYVYIYDKAGVEIHRLGKHIEVTHMEFLPYHFLLATIVSFWMLLVVTNVSFYQDSNIGSGKCRSSQVRRHIYGSDGRRVPHQTWTPNEHVSKSV